MGSHRLFGVKERRAKAYTDGAKEEYRNDRPRERKTPRPIGGDIPDGIYPKKSKGIAKDPKAHKIQN